MNEKIFKKKYGVFIEVVDNEYYLIGDFEAFKLNEVGARIVDLCDGNNSCLEIAKKLSRKYGCLIDEVQSDVNDFISVLLDQELVLEV